MIAVIVEARLVLACRCAAACRCSSPRARCSFWCRSSLGILISARTSSQRVAMMGALVGTMLPNVLLSGFIFPVESMPWPLRACRIVVPARWFVTIARGIMLKGVGLDYLWRETLVLAAMALVLLAASTRSFKERLE